MPQGYKSFSRTFHSLAMLVFSEPVASSPAAGLAVMIMSLTEQRSGEETHFANAGGGKNTQSVEAWSRRRRINPLMLHC